MGQEIGLCARGASGRGQQLARDDIAAQEKAARAMTDILELAPLHFTGSQRQSWMLALQRLHASQLVGAHGLFALLCQLRCLLIQATDRFHRFLLVRICWRGQPIADQMRLEIVFFNSRAACRGEICATMPRRMTSSAISRPVHWLIGRSFGCSQAMATIWQVCSAVIWACRPGRGTSQRRSFTGKSSKEAACKPIQRMRHMRTVSTQMPNSRAICELFLSSAAARMMRPRRASCWGVPCRRTSASTSVRSVSLKVSRSGLGPRMLRFLLLVCDLIILQTYFSRNVLDLRRWTEEAMRNVGRDIATFASQTWANDELGGVATDMARVLLVGGGAYYFYREIARLIPHVIVPQQPELANALGYAALARHLRLRRESI